MMEYNETYKKYLDFVNSACEKWADKTLGEGKTADAAKYSLFAGGKRVRGVLTAAVCDMLGADISVCESYAAAVEMLHCYSLIHDDLPCMDNDDFRRGKPSCHKAYSEALALLAGDALLTASFETVSENQSVSAFQNVTAVQLLAKAAGGNGMVYGQELDLAESTDITEQKLCDIHTHKTGDLINAAVLLGAVAANADELQMLVLSDAAYKIGLVFQITDDVLDVVSTSEQLGKPVGSDAENGKVTFAVLKGIEECKKLITEITDEACGLLREKFGEKSIFLTEFAQNLAKRTM